MSSSNKNSEEPLSGGTVQTSLCCIQEFPKDEENKFRAFVHNFKRTKRKIRFISCLLTFFWCSQTANNVVVIHDNTTQPTHPSTPQKYLGVYVAISCCWVLHLPVLAFLETNTPLHCILQVSAYLSTIVYVVVVQGIMGCDSEPVHDIWVLFGLVGCLSFTFKQLIPLFILTMVCNVIVSATVPSPYVLLHLNLYLCCVFLVWDRENKFRLLSSVVWSKEGIKSGLLKSQRHAIHDVRNVLQEVLGIVEMGSSFSPSGASSTSINVLEKGEKKQADSVALSISKETPTESDVVLRVRDAVFRMTARLETSLRDGRNTGMDERHRLVPVIHPCNLGEMILEDYILDPLVCVKLSPDFPNLCETDSEWIKTVVLNLVSNGKKHGPAGRPVEVNLSWTTCQETSAIHIAVTDQGVGVSPARSREIWSGTDTGGGIGISAIKSYVHGLGGTCGNNGPVFWVEVPGGMTHSAFAMSPWTLRFASKKAEKQFVIFGHQPSTTTTTVGIAGFVTTIVYGVYMGADGRGFGRQSNQYITPEILLVFAFFFLELALVFGVVYFVHRPTLQWWCRAINIFGGLLLDALLSLLVMYSDVNGLSTCETQFKFLPGAFIFLLNTCVWAHIVNTPLYTHLFPMFVVLLIGRVGLCISPVYYNDAQIAYETVFARLLQVLFLCISFYFLKILELKRRTRYVANVAKKDQARELRILALSARVRAEEVQREASRAAAHQVANIFNMLLSATMQMQQSMTEVQQEKLHSCTAVVVECRKEFIALQKTSLIIDRVSETVAVGVKEQQQDHNNLQLLDDGLASEEASDKGDSGGGGGDGGGGGGGGGGNNRVCVIDDNDFCREFIMHKIAKILGEKYQVDGIGTSAQAALEHLLKQGSASAYDLVLVDMSMPMNTDNTKGQHENKRAGLWVVSQFKSVHPSSSTKFLCLSGMGHDPNLIGRCKDAGFIVPYALGKPVEWGIMEKILKKHYC